MNYVSIVKPFTELIRIAVSHTPITAFAQGIPCGRVQLHDGRIDEGTPPFRRAARWQALTPSRPLGRQPPRTTQAVDTDKQALGPGAAPVASRGSEARPPGAGQDIEDHRSIHWGAGARPLPV